MVRRRCGGFSSRDGTVHMLDDGAAFACCWRAAASRAQWDAEHVTVKRSFIRETLALVDALEDDYPGSLSYCELENATLLWRVSCSLEDASLDCVGCSMDCQRIIYELRCRCRKVRTLRLHAPQSVESSLESAPASAAPTPMDDDDESVADRVIYAAAKGFPRVGEQVQFYARDSDDESTGEWFAGSCVFHKGNRCKFIYDAAEHKDKMHELCKLDPDALSEIRVRVGGPTSDGTHVGPLTARVARAARATYDEPPADVESDEFFIGRNHDIVPSVTSMVWTTA